MRDADFKMVSLLHDSSAWPPGAMMSYNNHEFSTGDARHFAVGLVISNTGTHITVLWPEHCREQVLVYEITKLNALVIKKVRL